MKRVAFLSAMAAQSALLLVAAACTEGTTPDCRSPDAGCGPAVDGSSLSDAAEGGAVDAPADAVSDSSGEAGQDGAAGDASEAGSDAGLDADAQGG